jgi:hypothetical protein
LYVFLKKGTTWVEEIAWLLNNNLDYKNAADKPHFERVLWLDIGYSKDYLEEMEAPRVFKSHLLPKYLPDNFNKIQKVIYVARNPKDVIVSCHAFSKNLTGMGNYCIEDTVELFTNDQLFYGPWFKHVDTYYKMQHIHFIQYENLQKVSDY